MHYHKHAQESVPNLFDKQGISKKMQCNLKLNFD